MCQSKTPIGINQMSEPMKIQCSCSACNFRACLSKQPTDSPIHNNSNASKLYFNDVNSYGNELDKNTEKLDDNLFTDDLRTDEEFESLIQTLSIELGSRDEIDSIQNVTVTNSIAELKPSSAKLSARIMNVPYNDLKSSIFPGKTEQVLKNDNHKMAPFDLFQKIKDVYKACSCKVCQCITRKSRPHEFCRCSPCKCDDCNRFLKKMPDSSHALNFFQTGVVCPKFERDSLRKIINSRLKEHCNCRPCDCVQCIDSVNVPCVCKSCQCIECTPQKLLHKHQKLVVAAVTNCNQFNQACQCSPCDCHECSQRFGATSNSTHQEMSTGLNRHLQCRCETCINETCVPDDNDTCGCERDGKVIRKPVQRDTDYDIRRTFITQNMKEVNEDKHDIRALFATVLNRYPYSRSQRKECSCSPCECLYCSHKEVSFTGASNTYAFSNSTIGNNIMKQKYSPNDFDFRTKDSSLSICNCGKCDCLNCEKLSKPLKDCENINPIRYLNKSETQKEFSSKANKFKFNPCECTYYDTMMSTCTRDICYCTNCKCEQCGLNEVIYPINKGEKLTPVIHENKFKGSFTTITHNDKGNDFEMPTKNLGHLFLNNYKIKFQGDVLVDECGQCNLLINSSSNEHQFLKKINTKLKREKQTHHIDFSELSANVTNTFSYRPVTNFRAFTSNASINSSVSNFKNSESYPRSEARSKSQESSCNSSGRDNCNYLVQFPRKAKKTNISGIAIFDNSETDSKQDQIKKYTNVSPSFYNDCAKDLYTGHISYRSEDNGKIAEKLNYDECSFVKSNNFTSRLKQANVSNECGIKQRENIKLNTTQIENINDCWITRSGINDSKQSGNFSKLLEEAYITDNMNKNENVVDLTTQTKISESYKSVQNTLNEAREFSLQLVKILRKYEQANREFESVSETLKQSNKKHIVSLSKEVSRGSKNTLMSESSTNFTKKRSIVNMPTKDEHVNYMYLNRESLRKNKKDETDIPVKSTQYSKESKSKENSIQSDKNSCDGHKNTSSPMLQFKRDNSKHLNSSSSDSEKSEINFMDDSQYFENNQNPKAYKNESLPGQTKFSTKCRNLKKKKINKMYKQTVIAYKNTNKKRCVAKATTCSITKGIFNPFIILTNDNYSQSDKLIAFNLNKQPEVKINRMVQVENAIGDVKSAATTNKTKYDHHNELENSSIVIIKPPAEPELGKQSNDTKPMPILKKTSVTAESQAEVKARSIEQSIQEIVTAIKETSTSLQSNFDARRKNDTLMKDLQCNVKRIAFQNTQNIRDENEEEPKATNVCDDLKVYFISARKVSSHTIMVKWNAPKALKDVQGYELLVDGRTMKKIDDVTRCSAVVTGIPKSDKILLTVRTVTMLPSPSGHNPSTTVVYRRSYKKSSNCCNSSFHLLGGGAG